MTPFVFLLEEISMKVFLEGYLRRLLPDLYFLCVAHEGKQDLERRVPGKLRAWKNAFFVVARDNDCGDCLSLKMKLRRLCEQAGRPDTLIRIPCQELEAWYLGVPAALAIAYDNPRLESIGVKAKYRDPDAIAHPSLELATLIPGFGKIDAARRMAQVMPLNIHENRSSSFRVFIQSIVEKSTILSLGEKS